MARTVAVSLLLGLAVAVTLVSVVGVAVRRDPYERLHYVAPISGVAAPLVALAVLLEESFSRAGIKAIAVAVLLFAANAVLTHATARAARLRRGETEAPARRPRKRPAA